MDNIKNPFEDGFPKPVVVIPQADCSSRGAEARRLSQATKPKPVVCTGDFASPLNLQGVMVGEDMHEAIINDQVVPLQGTIEGARVDSVTKEGVELFFKGKKFFLKVD